MRVIDASTGVGIPLVECKTTQQTTYWSDSAGYVVIHEPGLDGEEMFLQSRAHDETGYVQPTKEELREVRGLNSIYHNNCIQTWWIKSNGEVENVEIS